MSTATVVQTRAVESEAAALHRLARQARDKGVEIIIDEDNRHWATSVSRPGERYVVTLASCSCAGFCRHSRCHHFAAILAEYHSLPALPAIAPEPGPDGGGVAMAAPTVTAWTVAHEPDGERPPFAVRYAGADVVDRPVRRFWREHAARTEADVLNRAAARQRDIVVSIVPARESRRGAVRVENPHTVTKPSPVTGGATVSWVEADGVEVDGRMHGVGDQVVYVLNQGRGWTDVGTIQSIYRTTEHGRWKVVIRETGYGRYVADLRAVRSEEVRHVA